MVPGRVRPRSFFKIDRHGTAEGAAIFLRCWLGLFEKRRVRVRARSAGRSLRYHVGNGQFDNCRHSHFRDIYSGLWYPGRPQP
jgi:hypothetical protein